MKKLIIQLYIVLLAVSSFAQSPDRSSPPSLGPAKNLQLPPIQRFQLSNGLNVILMEKHTVPLVQVNLLVESGSVEDPPGKEGLCSMTLDLMDEGAGEYDALQLADEIEFLGASIHTYTSLFNSGVNCSTPVSKLDAVLSLMGDIVLRPSFNEREIDRIRQLRLNRLLLAYDDPAIISRRAFDQLIYDKNAPYGKAETGETLRSISKDDITTFYKAHFLTENSTLIVVGDVDRSAITPLLEKHFSTYPKGAANKAERPVPGQVKGRNIYVVDKPDAAQSVIRIGRIGTSRNDPQYENIVVMNTILGGSFASRLNTNLRETHGYSYGAGSAFRFWNIPGPFVASSSVQTDVTAAALKEFFNEFLAIRKPLPEAEFTRGKNYEALGYAANFETNSDIATALAELVLFDLPDNYFNTYIERVLTVKKKKVEAAAKKYIVPENFLIVIVGDRQKIETGLASLSMGKVTYLTIEDVLGKKPEL